MQSKLVRVLVVAVAALGLLVGRGVRHRGQRNAPRGRGHHRVRDEAGHAQDRLRRERMPPQRDGAEVERHRTEGRSGAEGRPGARGEARRSRGRRASRARRATRASGDRARPGRGARRAAGLTGATRGSGPAGGTGL